jgi:predicted membrane GTPase involved in stress response
MSHLLTVLGEAVPAPRVLGGPDDPFRMLVCQMEGDQYMGKLVLGRCVVRRRASR